MPDSAPPLLVGEDLEREFRTGPEVVRVLRGASVTVHTSEVVALIGASGVGKSTLLHVLGALDRPSGGRVLFDGEDLFARGEIAPVKAHGGATLVANDDDPRPFHRDHAIPGLAMVLDPDTFATALRRAAPDADLRTAQITYRRYKPQNFCRVAYRLDVAGAKLDLDVRACRCRKHALDLGQHPRKGRGSRH